MRILTEQERQEDVELVTKAQSLIPGGAHTYSRGEDQFPTSAPHFLVKGKGVTVWDNHGRSFVDFGMSLYSIVLGHADEAVLNQVNTVMQDGLGFSRPTLLEQEVAEESLSFFAPWADMIKFAKNGSDVTSAAVRLARAATGRKIILRCADHPFFSFDDWFIGNTVVNSGIPCSDLGFVIQFPYNDLNAVRDIFSENPDAIAGIILEPIAFQEPQPGFLEGLRELCDYHHSVLIFDEMISGLRFASGGAHQFVNVIPDLVTFGKAIGNGHSVSFVAGKREIMELGGLSHSRPRVFLMSSTHGAETQGLAALRAVVRTMRNANIIEDNWNKANLVQIHVRAMIKNLNLCKIASYEGFAIRPSLRFFDEHGKDSAYLKSAFLEEMFQKGIFMLNLAFCRDHDENSIARLLEGFEAGLTKIARSWEEGNLMEIYKGPVLKPVFRKYN